MIPTQEEQIAKLENALAVLTKDPRTKSYLEVADPKALEQAQAALSNKKKYQVQYFLGTNRADVKYLTVWADTMDEALAGASDEIDDALFTFTQATLIWV